jgi:hypothetical protein
MKVVGGHLQSFGGGLHQMAEVWMNNENNKKGRAVFIKGKQDLLFI